MFKLMFDETLRRIGEYCTLDHWLGGGGAYGWMSRFHDPSNRWFTSPNAGGHAGASRGSGGVEDSP